MLQFKLINTIYDRQLRHTRLICYFTEAESMEEILMPNETSLTKPLKHNEHYHIELQIPRFRILQQGEPVAVYGVEEEAKRESFYKGKVNEKANVMWQENCRPVDVGRFDE